MAKYTGKCLRKIKSEEGLRPGPYDHEFTTGQICAWVWDLVLPHLEFPALAVDLPGHGKRIGNLLNLYVADCETDWVRIEAQGGLEKRELVEKCLRQWRLFRRGSKAEVPDQSMDPKERDWLIGPPV